LAVWGFSGLLTWPLLGALDQTSLAHVRGIAWLDDWALSRVGELQAARPDRTVVVWQHRRTSWRKTYLFQCSTGLRSGTRPSQAD
jgi:hypothetical protein